MYEIYMVMENDSIDDISNLFNTTSEVIYKLNGIKDIKSGMQIVVPKREKGNYFYYTVEKGDNLNSISKKFDVDEGMLILLNGLDDEDYIYPNQTLIIPNKDVFIYMTKENDTFNDIIDISGGSIEGILKENEKIFLMPGQIIAFRKK